MADANLRAVITAEDRASSVLKGFSNSLDDAKTGSFALLGGLTALAVGAGLAVKAFSDSENKAAQLDAVLKSTAGVAGVTRDAAIGLSQALERQTTFSDEAVLSAENLLLTFTSIGKDIFPQATKTVLDMSIALGEDTKSAAIQLGKALQDPILGVTALRRVGVNFNQAQQDVIANLVNTGQQAKAQQLILKELNTEFGGSATAAAKTFSGQLAQLKNMIDDTMEVIGKMIADGIRPFVQSLMDAYNAMGGADGIGRKLTDTLQKLHPYFPIIGGAILGGLVPALYAMASAIVANLIALAPFIIAGAAIAGIALVIHNNWGKITSVFNDVGKAFKSVYDTFALIITGDFKHGMFGGWISEDSKYVGVLLTIRDTVIAVWNAISGAFMGAINAIVGAWNAAINWITGAWHQFTTNFWQDIGFAIGFAITLIPKLLIAFGYVLGEIGIAVVNAFIGIIGWIASIDWGALAVKLFVAYINMLVGIGNFFINTFMGIVNFVANINWGAIAASVGNAFVGMWNWVKNAALDAFHFMVSINWGQIMINIGKGIANAIIDLVNGALKGAFSGVPVLKDHVPQIPHFAKGVQNFTGGLAVVGEQGRELVSLPNGSSVIPNNQTEKLLGGAGQTINITVQAGAFMGNPADARKYAQLIANALNDVAASKNMTANQMLGA